jgi:drug/metabolite transporter (DMT)-like permease
LSAVADEVAPPSLLHRWRWGADLLLMFATLIWGGTFLVVQESVHQIGAFEFLAIRFSIAGVALAAVFPRRVARLTWADARAGTIIGGFLFAGYALQTLALEWILSSRVGFFTGMSVVIVPVLALVLLRQRLSVGATLGVLLAALGLGLLSLGTHFDLNFGPGEELSLVSLGTHIDLNFGIGEWLAFGCAVAFAGQIIAISRFAPHADAMNLALVQIVVTAVCSAVAAPFLDPAIIVPSAPVWISAFFMGVVATAFTLAVMNRVQQFVSSTRAALIYALEPVFAGLFGYLAGERLSLPAWLGCGLIFAGMILSELPVGGWWRRLRWRAQHEA